MAEDDSEWVLESIVGYLGSPEWVIPVTDFIENKCTGKNKKTKKQTQGAKQMARDAAVTSVSAVAKLCYVCVSVCLPSLMVMTRFIHM